VPNVNVHNPRAQPVARLHRHQCKVNRTLQHEKEHTMFTTTPPMIHAASPLEWHAPDGYGPSVACIDVKVYRTPDALAHLDERALERLAEAWSDAADALAAQHGFTIEQDGRSGGWAVLVCDGRRVTRDDVVSAAFARRLERAAFAVAGVATDVALLELADDLGLLDDPVTCDACGGPCDPADAVTDDAVNLCGAVFGNGCADAAAFDTDDVTVDQHAVDGFTCWWTDPRTGAAQRRRFIGYTINEAVDRVVAAVRETVPAPSHR
jgi:hypothetical protein